MVTDGRQRGCGSEYAFFMVVGEYFDALNGLMVELRLVVLLLGAQRQVFGLQVFHLFYLDCN